jgi:tetratricopeptide (TPR) repeat protein
MARRAIELDPLSPLTAYLAASVFTFTQERVAAHHAAESALKLDPSFPMGHLAAGWSHHLNARLDSAIEAYRRCADMTERSPFALGYLGRALAEDNRENEARVVLEEMAHQNADTWHAAQIHWQLGEHDRAFNLLDRSCKERNPLFFILARSPGLEILTRDERWIQLLQAADLSEIASGFDAQMPPNTR